MEFGVNVIIPMIDGIKLSDIKFGNIITCRSNIPYEFNQYDIIEYKNLKLVMIYDKCRDILRDKLLKLYSEYQPDKLPVVDTVIDEWEMSKLSGDNLLEILNQRYCNKKSENDNKSIEKSISVIEENDKEESSVTLDTISLSPIKLLVHQPNTEDSQSQQQQSQSQSQPLLLSQQEISLNSPLIIGNPEKENNLFYNKNEIINTNTKLRKKLDENMRGIDTPILNKNTYIEEENNIVKNTSISDEEKMENKKEEIEILNNSSKSTIDDISDIVTFVNIKNTNTNNNNEKSPELNSFNKQMTNFSTPSPINITNATTSDTSNISTPIILLNGQISDNNNNNNRIYNESFSSLTTPSPIKTNISLIKSFDSSAATTPIPIMKCNNKMEEEEKENNTDIKETEIIKREPIERMLEMSNEDEIINNTVDECIIQNENKENESYCNSDIIVNMNIFKNKDIKKENNDNVKEEEESKQKENEKVDKIEMEEEDEERDEKENVEKVINEEYKQNEKNKIDEETTENEVKVENENDENKNLTPQYEVTVRKTRGMLKREEEEEERRRKEVEESKEVTNTRKTIQSKCRNNKRKTVLTKRNRRSRKVKETENDDDNDDNNDKEEDDDEEIKNTNQEKVKSTKEEEKEKSTQKETPKIEVKEEVVKLENEINEELLSSQVYGKSTDEKEEEEEEENNTPQRKRRISSSGSIDNSSPSKKQKESITKSKRKRSSESPSSNTITSDIITEIKKRKMSGNSDYHIAITGLEKDEYEPIVKLLGGKFENDITKATHLLVKNLKRTLKLMYAMCCSDIHILSVKWLSDSKKKGHFVSEKTYVPSDPKTEKEYHYHFINSYIARNTRSKPLFDAYNFYLTPNVIPPINELIKLIKKGGGQVISSIRDLNRYEGNTLMIADEKDIDLIPKEYQEKVYSTQLIICSIMEQKVDTESHLIVNNS